MGETGVPRGEGGGVIVLTAPKTEVEVATSPEDGQNRLKSVREHVFGWGGARRTDPKVAPCCGAFAPLTITRSHPSAAGMERGVIAADVFVGDARDRW